MKSIKFLIYHSIYNYIIKLFNQTKSSEKVTKKIYLESISK